MPKSGPLWPIAQPSTHWSQPQRHAQQPGLPTLGLPHSSPVLGHCRKRRRQQLFQSRHLHCLPGTGSGVLGNSIVQGPCRPHAASGGLASAHTRVCMKHRRTASVMRSVHRDAFLHNERFQGVESLLHQRRLPSSFSHEHFQPASSPRSLGFPWSG